MASNTTILDRVRTRLVRALRLDDTPDDVARLRADVATLSARADHALAWLEADLLRARQHERDVSHLASALQELTVRLDSLEGTVRHLGAAGGALREELDGVRHHLNGLGHLVHELRPRADLAWSIVGLRAVVSAHRSTRRPVVTVVTPTHDRRPLLEDAVRSVRAQTYDNWELVIAVDRCSDDTLGYVEELAASDPRVRYVVTDHGRAGAARNAALRQATGSIVTYLDDDNAFDDVWLASVVWAFDVFPALDVLYGVLVIDHPDAVTSLDDPQTLPELYLHPFDRELLTRANIADMGQIAHRSGMPEAHFDEDLRLYGDWELFGRLAAVSTPLALPALSVIYRTAPEDRLSYEHVTDVQAFELVTSRLRSVLLDDAVDGQR